MYHPFKGLPLSEPVMLCAFFYLYAAENTIVNLTVSAISFFKNQDPSVHRVKSELAFYQGAW